MYNYVIFLSSFMVRGNHVLVFCPVNAYMDVLYAIPGLALKNLLHKPPYTLFFLICQLGLEDPSGNSEGTVEPDGRSLDLTMCVRWNALPTCAGS